jgi:hypothetical protein
MLGALLWQLEYRGTGRLASPASHYPAHGAALVDDLRLNPDAPPNRSRDKRAIMREMALTYRRVGAVSYHL